MNIKWYLAMISLLLWLEHRVKHCQIFAKKKHKWEKIIFSWSIREKSQKYWIVQGMCVFFTNTAWIVGPLGQPIKLNFRLKFCFSGYSAGIHITHQTSKHGFVAIQCASINVLPTFLLYVRFSSRAHQKF